MFYGAGLLLCRLGLGGLRARKARQFFEDAPRAVAGKEARGLAQDRPRQLAFQQRVKAGYADGLELPGELKGGHSGEEALARHPLSFPEAAGGDHRLVEAIVAATLPAR
ncbi:hypothetical protein [Poseidonocella sp. HB161398]|uniref:hypothetical protein n=1 Tax=Poseidonocella sp. HB161398 TaxID=2320855 RepID=UPI001109EAC9|nr:hypothetical protein [Poseidonocella sp. HB161398]